MIRVWKPTLALLLGSAASILISCSSQQGAFDAHGYRHKGYGYRVLGDDSSVLGDEWQLDNFYRSVHGKLAPKTSDDYELVYELDADGDGEAETSEKLPRYDLRYVHRKHGGVIWLRTFPISQDLKEKDLRLLLQQYIEEVAGGGYEAAQLSSNRKVLIEKRFACIIRERGTGRVAGNEAYLVTTDVVNLDQERVTPGQHHDRVRFVLIRVPFVYRPPFSDKTATAFPVLMLAAYANVPEDFDRDLPAFVKFLENVEIGKKRGVRGFELEVLNQDPTPPLPSIPNAKDAPAPVTPPAPDATNAPAPPPANSAPPSSSPSDVGNTVPEPAPRP